MVRLALRLTPSFLLVPAFLGTTCGSAFAHASEGGHILLLPTGYYLAGGAAAVTLSFLMLAFLPPEPFEKAARLRIALGAVPSGGRIGVSLLSFLLFALLIMAGFTGSRDPLANPLPLFIWTPFWVGLTLISGVIGDVWTWINPWYGPWRLLRRLNGHDAQFRPPLRMPAVLGRWPALVLLFAFAWFELVYPAPEDPWRLAAVAAFYWLFTFAGILLFGYDSWIRRVEFLSVFFTAISHLSLLGTHVEAGSRRLFLHLPGAKAAEAAPRPPGGVAFLLLALATVSFDGFMRTFRWLAWIGVNPLDFPGRSALILPDTAGLFLMFVLLSALFLLVAYSGERMVRTKTHLWRSAGLLIWSIVPIALAYHFAHYLTILLVNGQYFIAAISDPFALGWNLFGTAGMHIHAGIVLGAESAWIIWNFQAAAIIIGHMLAVAIAHVVAYRIHRSARIAAVSQIPLAILMVGYTVFGLWLLASPSAG